MEYVDELNEPRWRNRRQTGFYEVWYVTVAVPESGQAFWFRYTIDAPVKGEPTCALWAFSFDKNDAKAGLALHDSFPIERFANKTTDDRGFKVEVGTGSLERARAKGKVGSGAASIEWDLKFEPRGPSLEHVSSALYSLGLAKAQVNSANLALQVDGTIKVAGKSIKLAKAPAEQSHTWGKKHVHAYAWAHCNAFAEDPEAVFEGVSAKLSRFGIVLPAATPIYLRAFGEEHSLNGTGESFGHDSAFELGKWSFEASNDEVLVKGTAKASPDRFVSVEYGDPDGESLYCNNCCLADLSIDIYKKVGMRWEKANTLTSQGTTAFEVCERARDPRPARKLDLVEARKAEA